MSDLSLEPMLELYIFETSQLLEQLEQILISSEKLSTYSSQDINEIFRIMHTIKGSSAMMLYDNISSLAHSMEDLFYYIRETKPSAVDFSGLTDLILKCADFIGNALSKIEQNKESDAEPNELIGEIQEFLEGCKMENLSLEQDHEQCKKEDYAGDGSALEVGCGKWENENLRSDENTNRSNHEEADEKLRFYIGSDHSSCALEDKVYKAVIHFDEGCQMENIRAFSVIHNLKELVSDIQFLPPNIVEDDGTEEIIRKEGFTIYIQTPYPIDTIRENLMQTVFLKSLSLEELDEDKKIPALKKETGIPTKKVDGKSPDIVETITTATQPRSLNQNMISVNITKLDKLMDLVGELVISEAMVTQNSDLQGLTLDNFNKAARQLRKISGELQDTVMSIRMVPLSATFQRMNRIVRDMCKKLGKNVELEIIGEETEVDKNIIEHISDPLMHLIRNAIDHGIETKEERIIKGKPEIGKITLEAKNAGGDVLIIVKDDGKGLDRDRILEKAKENGLVNRPESDFTHREVFSLIFLPGFSTKENVSEYSGRGVGMDVVTKNIEKIGGTVSVDSASGQGTTVTIKIPLTLAIVGGMNIQVGRSIYTIPTISIRESFRPGEDDVFTDPDGHEMILIRGQCYPIIRLHQLFKVKTNVVNIHEGIIVMVENGEKSVCIFADALLGEQQVVVKALPKYIKKVKGLAGCTLLGNGNISLILNVEQLIGAD